MISIVCVYNDQAVLQSVLLNSLKNQTVQFELITLDNRSGRFGSAAEALNHGGATAIGDYIMFVHQDMWLGTDSWIEDVERILETIPSMGVAGVAGMRETGRSWDERVSYSIDMPDEASRAISGRVDNPEEVQTLDECLLIVPKKVFDSVKFDEEVFDGWDCYGADYCLGVSQQGLRSYVVPAPCSHCCARAAYPIWHFQDLLEYQQRLYRKHKARHRHIHTWMGEVSWLSLRLRQAMRFVGPLYHTLFPTSFDQMRKELSDCDSVLDLGCGHHSAVQTFNTAYSVGVEMFEASLQESRRKRIHSQYLLGDMRQLAFKPKSFDAVIAVEVLEHVTKQEGLALLAKMGQWARKRVIITTPNGFHRQDIYDNNPLQEHRSGWSAEELKELGFIVRGTLGWKLLRGEKGSIRHRPAFLWARLSDLTQKVAYSYPKIAFQLYAVKRIDRRD